jgi:hypothetical protein
MWMRRGLGSCWKNRDPNDLAHVNRAIDDLIRRGDDKPSFFHVHGCEEVHGLAELFAVTVLPGPQSTDFLLLPESGLLGFLLSFSPDPNLHPYLRQRHFELQGMDNRHHLESFIRRAFGIVWVERLQRNFLSEAFQERLCRDADVLSRCNERWRLLH